MSKSYGLGGKKPPIRSCRAAGGWLWEWNGRWHTLRSRCAWAIWTANTPKGTDAIMGATSIKNASRPAIMLDRLSEKAMQNLNLPPSRVKEFFYLNYSKTNYSREPETDEIYQISSVRLGNSTPVYPNGDEVGVVVRFDPTNIGQTQSTSQSTSQSDLIALRLVHAAPANALLSQHRSGSNNSRSIHAHLQKALRLAKIPMMGYIHVCLSWKLNLQILTEVNGRD